jgi:hypothetical protein
MSGLKEVAFQLVTHGYAGPFNIGKRPLFIPRKSRADVKLKVTRVVNFFLGYTHIVLANNFARAPANRSSSFSLHFSLQSRMRSLIYTNHIHSIFHLYFEGTVMSESGKKAPVIAVVVLLLAAGGAIIYNFRDSTPHPSKYAYFVDESSGQEYTRSINDIPPVTGSDGKVLVREVKYSVDGTPKVAYYYKFTDSMKKKLEEIISSGKEIGDTDVGSGQLVRSPAPGSKWLPATSVEGQALMQIDLSHGKVTMLQP